MPNLREIALTALVLVGVVGAASACSTPEEAGVQLGETHVDAIRADELTLEQMAEDLREAEERYSDPKDRKAFDDAYWRTIEPVEADVAAMMIEAKAKEVGGFVGALGRAIGQAAMDAANGVKGVAEDVRTMDEQTQDDIREAGREVGRVMRGLRTAFEAFAEGLEAELDEAPAPR